MKAAAALLFVAAVYLIGAVWDAPSELEAALATAAAARDIERSGLNKNEVITAVAAAWKETP